jgi:hypothetical protein
LLKGTQNQHDYILVVGTRGGVGETLEQGLLGELVKLFSACLAVMMLLCGMDMQAS